MHEYEPREMPPIRRLRNDLYRKNDSIIDVHMAFSRFVAEEFDIPEPVVDSMLETIRNSDENIFPDIDTFEGDEKLAIEQYRLAIWRFAVPLYESTHSPDEIDAWLPIALKVVLPANGRHQPPECLSETEAGVNDVACKFGNCPILVVRSDIANAVNSANFSSLEYIYDKDKVRDDTLRHIDHASKYHIFTPEEGESLSMSYDLNFRSAYNAYPDKK